LLSLTFWLTAQIERKTAMVADHLVRMNLRGAQRFASIRPLTPEQTEFLGEAERAVGRAQIQLAAIELADFWRVTPEKPVEGYHYFPGTLNFALG
jgi:hypothetical protein